MPTPVVFLDKDGTLIEDVPYNVDLLKIKFMDDVIPGLKKLSLAGYRLIIITNQSGVAR
jgi:D-glycero-D-manno-heptose 1,7-bisphosphate phosphatase